MPVAVSFPGVYIEELPSGVRTIAGVATSITAFVGRAAMGTDEPMLVNTFGDFERQFSSLDPAYPMSYAVRDFFQNGGARAVIVRLYKKKSGDGVNDGIELESTPVWDGMIVAQGKIYMATVNGKIMCYGKK